MSREVSQTSTTSVATASSGQNKRKRAESEEEDDGDSDPGVELAARRNIRVRFSDGSGRDAEGDTDSAEESCGEGSSRLPLPAQSPRLEATPTAKRSSRSRSATIGKSTLRKPGLATNRTADRSQKPSSIPASAALPQQPVQSEQAKDSSKVSSRVPHLVPHESDEGINDVFKDEPMLPFLAAFNPPNWKPILPEDPENWLPSVRPGYLAVGRLAGIF